MPRPYENESLHTLVIMIRGDWGGQGNGVNYAAKPYLNALATLRTLDENFGNDSGREIALRFLANAGSWRGAVARDIKAELKARLGVK